MPQIELVRECRPFWDNGESDCHMYDSFADDNFGGQWWVQLYAEIKADAQFTVYVSYTPENERNANGDRRVQHQMPVTTDPAVLNDYFDRVWASLAKKLNATLAIDKE